MKKVICKELITREILEDPFSIMPLKERLIKSKTINLENNHIIDNLGNGYYRVLPKDKDKIFVK